MVVESLQLFSDHNSGLADGCDRSLVSVIVRKTFLHSRVFGPFLIHTLNADKHSKFQWDLCCSAWQRGISVSDPHTLFPTSSSGLQKNKGFPPFCMAARLTGGDSWVWFLL